MTEQVIKNGGCKKWSWKRVEGALMEREGSQGVEWRLEACSCLD